MTHWTENDKDYIEGLICEINDLEDFNFFISATANPSVTRGYQWVCGSQISEVFPSSKKALITLSGNG